MNVKLKKRMTGTFEDLERGDLFMRFGYEQTVYLKTMGVFVRGVECEAVDINGNFASFSPDTEVEIIHGTFVEDGAE